MNQVIQAAVFFFIIGVLIGSMLYAIADKNKRYEAEFPLTTKGLPILKNRDGCTFVLDQGPLHTAVICLERKEKHFE